MNIAIATVAHLPTLTVLEFHIHSLALAILMHFMKHLCGLLAISFYLFVYGPCRGKLKQKTAPSPLQEMVMFNKATETLSEPTGENSGEKVIPKTVLETEEKTENETAMDPQIEEGSVEKEVKLLVRKEGEPVPHTSNQRAIGPVPVAEFGKYVEQHHANGNKPFGLQYKVRQCRMVEIV